jgi:hypothetical protein
MPWVKISSDAHKDMKQFLVDVEGLSLGDLVEAAFEFCMESVEDFEKFLGLEETEDESDQEEDADPEPEPEPEAEDQSDED